MIALTRYQFMKKGITSLWIGIVVISAFTAAITAFSGSLSGRWGTHPGLDEARKILKTLPMEIEGTVGTWTAEADRELDETSITMLKIQDAYVFRTYRNSITQEMVHLTLMVGPSGKISVHTPEVCFGGRDYEQGGARVRVPVNVQLLSGEETEDTFWRVDFTRRTLGMQNQISFYWALSTGGSWEASEDVRWTYRAYRYIYKLQVEAYSISDAGGNTVKKFLEDCLPTIHEHLRPYTH